jgi:murein tripeptide amidase MpaA
MTQWQTYFELSKQLDSPSYDETIRYFNQFVSATPYCRMKTFGMSAEGRPLHYLVVAQDNAFTPNRARRKEKTVVLIQNGIHPGEIEGKDATMLLLREMLITREKKQLLDGLVLIIIPVLNADGHERRTAFNRPNQNGPLTMGWRVTSQNYNLNRDYMKADSPEMRGLLKLYSLWKPDLYVDNHTTNGADYQYHITFGVERKQLLDNLLGKFADSTFIPHIEKETSAAGFIVGPYIEMKGERLEEGILEEVNLPRYSTGYAAAQNRLCLLVETHSLKPFANRVFSTKAMNEAVLTFAVAQGKQLRKLNKKADERTIWQYAIKKKPFPVAFGLDMNNPEQLLFKGRECHWIPSDITGAEIPQYSDSPHEFLIPFFTKTTVTHKVTLPEAYLLPREFSGIAGLLRLHGVKIQLLEESTRFVVEKYRLSKPTFAAGPYEGRIRVHAETELLRVEEMIPAGTYKIPVAQRALKVLVHLCEPGAEDSLLQWGFFNAFFERKEYAEPYVFEPIARRMLAEDPDLLAEFTRRLKNKKFAADPSARLDFFYERSPYFDERELIYPIFRLPANP